MRIKRPRSSNASTGSSSRHPLRRDAMENELALAHMDPNLMTERQQLAFLLRKTADSTDEHAKETPHKPTSKHTPQRSKPDGKTIARRQLERILKDADFSKRNLAMLAKVIYRGRGRPPKNAIKLPREQQAMVKQLVSTARATVKEEQIETMEQDTPKAPFHVDPISCSPSNTVAVEDHSYSKTSDQNATSMKSSPTSVSEAATLFNADSSQEAWECALCASTSSDSNGWLPCDALFLCTACDQKYPTQRTLGFA